MLLRTQLCLRCLEANLYEQSRKEPELDSIVTNLRMNRIHLIFLALCWACCGAEPQYFRWSNVSTWDQARQHCQVCYKEMVSLNPQNVLHLIQNLTTDYWIGLRKNLNGSDAWSGWSNGEPMSFQNWYPGRPVLSKPKVPVVYVMNTYTTNNLQPTCGCCCHKDTTNNNTFGFYENTSDTTSFSTLPPTTKLTTIPTTIPTSRLVSEPVTNGTTTDDEVVYLEDPCVSIGSSGLWFEKNCSERLSYICFEERFYGKAEVTNITLHNANLTWLAGPGDISHYLVNVRGEQNLTFNQNELTYYFTNLTPGALYTVQVFPIKCERELNPQNTSFYTKPDVVNNLNVTNVTETAVFLSWNPPSGKSDLYQVRMGEMKLSTKTEFKEVGNLTPGGFYTFEVNVEVNNSKEGDRVNISAYTKPSTVFNLKAIKPTFNSLVLNWTHPAGNYSNYRICVSWTNFTGYCNTTSGDNSTFSVNNLPAGTSVNMSVVVLVQGSTLEGDSINVTGFTAPGPVSNIKMLTDTNSIDATWDSPNGNYEIFCLNLRLAAQDMNLADDQCLCNISRNDKLFIKDIKSSVNYKLSIQTKNGNLKSEWRSITNFTLPKPPRNAVVISSNNTSANLTWDPPEDASGALVTYIIMYFAEFWNERYNDTVATNLTHNSYTFVDLRPGTNYKFSIVTLSGNHTSNPVSTSAMTDPNKSFLYLDMECSAPMVSNCTDAYLKMVGQLQQHISSHFKESVFWNLDEKP
ncbi:receptor-type tyrosine-protein phosphatase eta [Osmerus mordax]|uniref:receptor-type tyrosine-protein phosphatase eta n=1 Tax=Osmerus mordax TaxID=8014 RepID=UPI00350FB604